MAVEESRLYGVMADLTSFSLHDRLRGPKDPKEGF
jgi:hypothetical protein